VEEVCNSGYEIPVYIHLFDAADESTNDKAEAYLVGPSSVLVKMPSVNRVFLEDLPTVCEDKYNTIKAARKMSRVEIMTTLTALQNFCC
jgi:hypothetical protein